MNEIIKNLKTPEECEQFIEKYTHLINLARQRAIELRASTHGNINEIERGLFKAIYAYEQLLSKKNGRKTRASRTWQMVKKYGIIGTAERAVNRKIDAPGFKLLAEMGLQELTFESVIVKDPGVFSRDAVKKAKDRLEEFKNISI